MYSTIYAGCPKCESKIHKNVSRVVARYVEALGTSDGWIHRKEKDEQAENNIAPEHLLLWRKMKNRFQGTPDHRAEQFNEYLEKHPDELVDQQQAFADKNTAKLIREQEKKDRDQAKLEKAQQVEERKRQREQAKIDKRDALCKKMCPQCQGEPNGHEMLEDAPF